MYINTTREDTLAHTPGPPSHCAFAPPLSHTHHTCKRAGSRIFQGHHKVAAGLGWDLVLLIESPAWKSVWARLYLSRGYWHTVRLVAHNSATFAHLVTARQSTSGRWQRQRFTYLLGTIPFTYVLRHTHPSACAIVNKRSTCPPAPPTDLRQDESWRNSE